MALLDKGMLPSRETRSRTRTRSRDGIRSRIGVRRSQTTICSRVGMQRSWTRTRSWVRIRPIYLQSRTGYPLSQGTIPEWCTCPSRGTPRPGTRLDQVMLPVWDTPPGPDTAFPDQDTFWEGRRHSRTRACPGKGFTPGSDMPDLCTIPDQVCAEPGYAQTGYAPRLGYAPGWDTPPGRDTGLLDQRTCPNWV